MSFEIWMWRLSMVSDRTILAAMSVFEPLLIQQIKYIQFQGPDLGRVPNSIADRLDFRIVDGVLFFQDILCV